MPVSFRSSLRCAPIVLCAAGVLALTACGGSSSSGGQAASGSSSGGPSAPKQNPSTLTIAVTSTPVSINPALNGVGDPLELYSELSYDPLIYQKSDGSYAPGLATKWGFVGTGNKTFDMTLRPNVKFSDGSALTAQGVKNYFTYYHKASSFGSRLTGVKITGTGPLSPHFQLNAPDPDFAYLMTQDLGTGDVISPLGLKNPKALGTTAAGAGQYTLDSAATVTNQTYTFVRNPTYWDPSAIHWKKIVIKV